MSAAVSVAPRGERKAVAAALKQAAADPDTPTGAAQLDLENGNGAAEVRGGPAGGYGCGLPTRRWALSATCPDFF